MTCAIVVINNDGSDQPSSPVAMTKDGRRWPLRPLGTIDVGGFTGKQFAVGEDVIVIVKVAKIAAGIVCVIWVPSNARNDVARFLSRLTGTDLQDLIARKWDCEVGPSGEITSAALTAATGTIPNAVKAAWPVQWAMRTGAETQGDRAGTPRGVPLGALCVGAAVS